MNTLISVIVPVYNTESYLDRCITSILNQKQKNIELILIDDGSTDSSLEICKKWEKRDARVKVIHQENSGVSAARNIGIENSSGKYISFIDSDDFVDEEIYNAFNELYEKNIDLIRFRCKTFYGNLGIESKNFTDGFIKFNNLYEKYSLFFDGNTFGSVWSTLFRREILSNVRFETKYRYGEDYLFYFEVLENANTVYISNEVLYFYMINYSSATRRVDFEKEIKEIKDHFNVDFEVENFLRGHDLNSLLNDAWNSTISATQNWLKNLSKNYSYHQFKELVLNLKQSSEFINYLEYTDDYHRIKMKKIMDKANFGYYLKGKSIGSIKKTLKKVFYIKLRNHK